VPKENQNGAEIGQFHGIVLAHFGSAKMVWTLQIYIIEIDLFFYIFFQKKKKNNKQNVYLFLISSLFLFFIWFF